MPKVLISDKLSPKAEKIFTERGIEVDVITGLERDELIKIIAKYDGLAIRSSTKVTQKVLDAASNLKVVGRAGIGVDNVDIPYATSKGVAVMNTPFGNAITTAEHAISLIMSLVRNIPQANESTHGGTWEKSKYMGTEITGKTLGKGFQGGVKRHHFKTQDATHGNSISHRALGSTGQCQDPGRVFKGKKMPGHLGNVNRTIQNLTIVKIMPEETNISEVNFGKTTSIKFKKK